MSLIIKKNLRKFVKGAPTVVNFTDVKGGILEGSANITFGQAMAYGTETGFYKPFASAAAITELAGICLLTNVKVPTTYPAEANVETRPGEAFNLLVNGYVAVALAATAVKADIKEGAKVKINLTTGDFTTSSDAAGTALADTYFTGEYEEVGSTILAEIIFNK